MSASWRRYRLPLEGGRLPEKRDGRASCHSRNQANSFFNLARNPSPDKTVRYVRQRTDLTCSAAYSWAVFSFFYSLKRMFTMKSNANFKPAILVIALALSTGSLQAYAFGTAEDVDQTDR